MKKKISLFLTLIFIMSITLMGNVLNQKVNALENNNSQNLKPIHQYTFDKDNGDIVVDTGSMAGTDGKFNGKAYGTKFMQEDEISFRRFNGNGDCIKFSDSVVPSGKKSIKFKFRTQSNANMVLLDTSIGSSYSHSGICVGIGQGSIWYSECCSNGSSPNFAVSASGVNDNKWHDCLITWDGSVDKDKVKIYIDDLSKPIVTATAQRVGNYGNGCNLYVGKVSSDAYNSFYFNGDLSNIEIYNDVIDSSIQPQSITLNKSSITLLKGKSENLIATVKPDEATNKKVIWSSSDDTIASVDANGNVTALKVGKAIITAKVEGTDLTATCEVNVTEPNNDRAILAITMVNGITKEYDLSMDEIDAFEKWFDASNGKGQLRYGFNKTINPYKSVKEYVVFDKIASFEIRAYEVSK